MTRPPRPARPTPIRIDHETLARMMSRAISVHDTTLTQFARDLEPYLGRVISRQALTRYRTLPGRGLTAIPTGDALMAILVMLQHEHGYTPLDLLAETPDPATLVDRIRQLEEERARLLVRQT